MLIPDTKCKTMEKIDQEIANEYLDNLILNAINPIQKNRKCIDVSSAHEYLDKEMTNPIVTLGIIEEQFILLSCKQQN